MKTPPTREIDPREKYPPSGAVDSHGTTIERQLDTETDHAFEPPTRRAAPRSPRLVVGRGSASLDTDELEVPPDPIGGRYHATRALGQGAGGVVYEALDEFVDEAVAIKLLWPGTGMGSRRVAREIAALRVLDLPGVARLLDEGVHNGQRFIVMTLVRGKPFPGDLAMATWHALAAPTMALLETLHRVHEQGIIHRDLKPSNVLVDDEGRAVILDFGLARGSRLGDTITHSGAILGTPRYQAPEQMEGLPADARADLYAVGVMLYEALASRLPHEADTIDAMRFKRTSIDAAPLAQLAPETPAGVAAVVDWLLARNPEDRPQTAAEALTALQADADAERGELFPWLGSRVPVEALTAAVEERRPLDLGGAVGSGRSRAVREALMGLGPEVEVFQAGPGERPLQSLRGLVDLETLTSPDPEALLVTVDRRLEERLRDGIVVVADDIEHLDRWTVEALGRCRSHGAVIRVLGEEDACDVRLEALTAEALRDLFQGPDRLLHLREDGARELHARTSGLPLRIVRELAAWVGAGLASWRQGKLALTRESLRRLSARPRLAAGDAAEWLDVVTGSLAELLAWITLAWPHATPARLQAATGRPSWEIGIELAELARLGAVMRRDDGGYEPLGPALELPLWPFERRRSAHARLAELIEPGTQGRLAHLLAAGDAGEIAHEAVTASRQLYLEGQMGPAMGLLFEALPAVRALGSDPDEAKLLVELANLAISDQTPAAIRRAHYELERRTHLDPLVLRMDALLRAALELTDSPGRAILEQVDAVGSFEDHNLEQNRQMVRFRAAAAQSTALAAKLLVEIEPWARALPVEQQGFYEGWVGLVYYRQGNFDGAIRQHRLSEQRRPDAGRALAPPINAAIAMLEAFRLDEAEEAANRVLHEASRLRLPLYEAYAELVRRVVTYRRGDAAKPDVELAEAADALDYPDSAAPIFLNEAAIAWRNGDHETAADLARRARQLWVEQGQPLRAALPRALEIAVRGKADDAEILHLFEQAKQAVFPRIGAQILGLLSQVMPDGSPDWSKEVRRLAESTPQGLWGQRLEVLSLEESVAEPPGEV